MIWSRFADTFTPNTIPTKDLKGIAFVYVISHNLNEPPYKIGLTRSDLMRRMRSYQTAFIDFYIYYIIALPYTQVALLEKELHKFVKGRMLFPDKRKDQKTKYYSEWFNASLPEIETALDKIVMTDSRITPVFAYDLTARNNGMPKRIEKYEQDVGDVTSVTTRSGRATRLSAAGARQYNAIYFDNGRLWKGINFSMSDTKRRKNPQFKKYIGMAIHAKADGDNGVVTKVPDSLTKNASVKYSDGETYQILMRDIVKYGKDFGIRKYKGDIKF